MPDYTKTTFEDAVISEAKCLLQRHGPGKVGTPQGNEEMAAFRAGARFAKQYFGADIARLSAIAGRASECADRECGPAFGDAFAGGEASLRTAEYIVNG
jgi:hypothetical protein